MTEGEIIFFVLLCAVYVLGSLYLLATYGPRRSGRRDDEK